MNLNFSYESSFNIEEEVFIPASFQRELLAKIFDSLPIEKEFDFRRECPISLTSLNKILQENLIHQEEDGTTLSYLNVSRNYILSFIENLAITGAFINTIWYALYDYDSDMSHDVQQFKLFSELLFQKIKNTITNFNFLLEDLKLLLNMDCSGINGMKGFIGIFIKMDDLLLALFKIYKTFQLNCPDLMKVFHKHRYHLDLLPIEKKLEKINLIINHYALETNIEVDPNIFGLTFEKIISRSLQCISKLIRVFLKFKSKILTDIQELELKEELRYIFMTYFGRYQRIEIFHIEVINDTSIICQNNIEFSNHENGKVSLRLRKCFRILINSGIMRHIFDTETNHEEKLNIASLICKVFKNFHSIEIKYFSLFLY